MSLQSLLNYFHKLIKTRKVFAALSSVVVVSILTTVMCCTQKSNTPVEEDADVKKSQSGSGGGGGRPEREAFKAQNLTKDLIRSDFKPNELKALCDAEIARLKTRLDSEAKSAFDIDNILADFFDVMSPLTFMGNVHTDKAIRKEASACEEKQGQVIVDVMTRRDLYAVVLATATENEEQKRLVSEMRREFERNGLALDDQKLIALVNLKKQLATLETQFKDNLNNDTSTVEFSAEELAGVSETFLARLKKTPDGKFIVTTTSADYVHVTENAKNPATRLAILTKYENRAADENTELLKKAVILRLSMGQLLGFPHWAEARIDGRMAKNSANVMSLLLDLKAKLRPRLESDLKVLLEAKKQMEDPAATHILAQDVRYFANQVKKRDYAVDDEVIREYFPKDTVMAGLFQVYSTLLNVEFEAVTDAKVWHPDVKLYAVRDRSADKSILAYFYADLFPRAGKFGHAAASPLISGRYLSNSKYSQPVAAIMTNFTPPSKDKPSLLTHDEVETLFHEFGHIMHMILTTVPYAYLSGASVAQDYVEAPSQMLENWAWDKEILNLISGHYLDVSKKLPNSLVEKMIASKNFNTGYFYSRQLSLGLFDMGLHMDNVPVDVNDFFRKSHREVMGFDTAPGTHFAATFGHLMGGYDAGYYGYLWSEVFAADMFTAFQKEGLLNEKTGARYRQTILESGNRIDPLVLITNFLGREPNNEAFLKKLGL